MHRTVSILAGLVSLAALAAGLGYVALRSHTSHQPATAAPATIDPAFTQHTITHLGRTLAFALYRPAGGPPDAKLPLIIFLHGKGECGNDNVRQTTVGLGPALTKNPQRWPFIVALPQKPDTDLPWADLEPQVMALIDLVRAKHQVDDQRIYLSGLSQGGAGTWAIAAKHPDLFAAIAPICGYGDPDTVAPPLVNMPIWTFHGDQDTVRPIEGTRKIVTALEARGAKPKFTVYPGVNHNSWDNAYAEADLPGWLLSHTRPPAR